ncbi:MAG: hypothetical protein K9K78_07280 [Spirochaetales bacterium]|nr:hypothetical protein [Spirochaetales bacterium]
MKVCKKVVKRAAGILSLAAVLMISSCDLAFFENQVEYQEIPIPENSLRISDSDDRRELDLYLLETIFSEELQETLEEKQAIAEPAEKTRNQYSSSNFINSIGSPQEAYGSSEDTVRFPEADPEDPEEETFLDPVLEDPTKKGSFFTMEQTDTEDVYRVVYTVVENNPLGSLERAETIYYVSADSWTPFKSPELEEEGWESERTYYSTGEIGDREVIATGEDEAAKGAFIAPDYNPFSEEELDLEEGAIFTINIDKLYGEGTSLDDYFQDFWDGAPGGEAGDYSSFTRTYTYAEGTAEEDLGDPAAAASEQNDYYTEVGIDSYPEVLGISEGTPGRVRAGLSYYLSPVSENWSSGGNGSGEDDSKPLKIVNASSFYRDLAGNFLMEDEKSFSQAPESTYKHRYHHNSLYYNRNDILTYSDNRYFYTEADSVEVREDGLDSFDKRIMTEIFFQEGTWEGRSAIALDITSWEDLAFKVKLQGDYLQYRAYINGELFEFIPDGNGNIEADLPGGGHFSGSTRNGNLSGSYTSADGETVSF